MPKLFNKLSAVLILVLRQAGIYGLSRQDGGYAQVTVTNSKGKKVISALIDLYSKYPVTSLKFITPVMPKDSYTLTVTVSGERGNWSDRRKRNYGSTGNFMALDKVVVNQ